ncbi:hypothetical protein [Beggiatoa alba]|uniref:hypothetical protein n=1 Tax=Beggiatoa alba TaxID=1022 RepID=UPI0012F7FAAB|nr:hypothetical protein [Beggiatoa alba]
MKAVIDEYAELQYQAGLLRGEHYRTETRVGVERLKILIEVKTCSDNPYLEIAIFGRLLETLGDNMEKVGYLRKSDVDDDEELQALILPHEQMVTLARTQIDALLSEQPINPTQERQS